MKEAGCLIDLETSIVLYWHTPNNRSISSLPDSRELWETIWNNRNKELGFAHSHPGAGEPGPSSTDLSTFSVIELGLNKRLKWWITSSDTLVMLTYVGPENYQSQIDLENYPWLLELRERSLYV